MPKPDMAVQVNVNVTGTIDNNNVLHASATYAQGSTTPASTGVVQPNGNIDLTQMNDQNNDYSNETDITFMLSGTITGPGGQEFGVVFPDTVQQAVAITKRGGGPNELTPSLQSSTTLLIDDSDNDGQDYTYCLTVSPDYVSADSDVPTCPLDPTIVNR